MSPYSMSRMMTLSVAAFAGLLIAGSAFAQDGGQGGGQGGGQWGGGGHGGGGMRGPLGMLGRYDTDGDGKVSLAEYETGRQAMFARMDADNNGSISFAEIDAMEQRMESMGNGRGGDRMKARMEALKAADTNGDQAVSADEYKAASDAEFKTLDTNGDGFIDATEASAAMKP